MKLKKMNKNKLILLISIIVGVIFIIVFMFGLRVRKDKINYTPENTPQIDDQVSNQYEEMINNSAMYDENSTLEDLKEEYKITGSDEIYEIETEADGRKVIQVKANLNYKVAFCGMIQKSKPMLKDLDTVFEKNTPTKSGIWINPNDRLKILSYLNDNKYLKCKYNINEEGYLEITEEKNQTDSDNILRQCINGDRQYLINISSTYYMIDKVTGKIVDNPYNELDRYQTYDYCKDEDKMIIFISENQKEYLTKEEIFESVIDLLKIES